jgi:hypothetical protein
MPEPVSVTDTAISSLRRAGRDRDRPALPRGPHRVGDQIGDDPFDLAAVDGDVRQVGRCVDFEANALGLHLEPKRLDGFADESGRPSRRHLRRHGP